MTYLMKSFLYSIAPFFPPRVILFGAFFVTVVIGFAEMMARLGLVG